MNKTKSSTKTIKYDKKKFFDERAEMFDKLPPVDFNTTAKDEQENRAKNTSHGSFTPADKKKYEEMVAKLPKGIITTVKDEKNVISTKDENEQEKPVHYLFKKDPRINVVTKEEFSYRVDKVFHLLWQTLSKSFGPYGAPTLIYNYPYSHATKDGYTIMKNLSLDASESKIDQAIADMAGDICGRLNYIVGDGTTSAIIATNSIYKNYRDNASYFTDNHILPRDVMREFEALKETIISEFSNKIKTITNNDRDALVDYIRKVVYVSSNGDELITEYISDLYKELGAPTITCSLSPDGITRKRLIDGYKFDLSISDKLYINSDNKTMEITNSDIIIFGTTVTQATYTNILKPLSLASRARGRHLIVAAPKYDERALQQTISVDLNNEYRNTHKINMVLTTYKAINDHARRVASDFAMLMGTHIITRAEEAFIQDELASGKLIFQVFNIDDRKIAGTRCCAYDVRPNTTNNEKQMIYTYSYGVDELPSYVHATNEVYPLIENYVDLGFAKNASLGLRFSQFRDLIYDKKRYEACLADAKDRLDEAVAKYSKLGTFNVEVNLAQQRYYALGLRMGSIEVGGDSELSQKMLKDSVDDAVKAAASAYNHGVVYGCNLSLLQTIKSIRDRFAVTDLSYKLLEILYNGFFDVYKTVVLNAFEDYDFSKYIAGSVTDFRKNVKVDLRKFFGTRIPWDSVFDEEELDTVLNEIYDNSILDKYADATLAPTLISIIINYSINTSQVFDVSNFKYTKDVINSSETDEQILKATIDLISLLIVGNQMVITQKHNFE